MESTILLFTNICVSEITAINMSLTKEDIIKGLKGVTRKLEEGDEIGLFSDQVKKVAMGMKG